jgi:hypothetical protein
MSGRDLAAERDRPGCNRKGHREEEEGARAEETPQKVETRH